MAVGFLTRTGDQYGNTAVTQEVLSGQGHHNLRPILKMWDEVVYQQWAMLGESIRADRAAYGYEDLTAEQLETFTTGVAALTRPTAEALARSYDFSQHHSLLDLGGGTGSFVTAARLQYPQLRATVLERPESAPLARAQLAAAAGVGVDVVEGDLTNGPLPTDHDVILVANVVHLFSPAQNQQLLARIRAAARVALVCCWSTSGPTTPGPNRPSQP